MTTISMYTEQEETSNDESFEDFLDDGEPEVDSGLITYSQPSREIIDYPHQKEAFERYKDESVIALFLEMGLGKSKIILDIAKYKYKNKQIDSLCVIAPNRVHTQWAREQIPIWLQGIEYDLQIIGGKGGKKEGRRFRENVFQILVTNIDTFSTPKKWMDICDWANNGKTFIVVDEATCIKNPDAKRTHRLLYEFNRTQWNGKRLLKSEPLSVARAILTGTPVTNGPHDVWAMFEFLKPNYFNRNYYSFRNRYGMFRQHVVETDTGSRAVMIPMNQDVWERIKQINEYGMAYALFQITEDTFNFIHAQEKWEGPFKHVDELKKLMEPVSMYRRLEECVDMPEKMYITREVEMSEEQARIYKDMVTDMIAEYQDKEVDAKTKLVLYMRLRQIATGFISTIPDFELRGDEDDDTWEPDVKEVTWIGETNEKLEALKYDIEDFEDQAIVICHFTAEAHRLYEELSKIRKCGVQTGNWRVSTIESFQQGKYDILIANARCVSEGLNLQMARRMFFYSNSFSLKDRLQVEGRIFRIGQTRTCMYTDYRTKGTIEEKIVAALQQKKNLLDYIRHNSVRTMLS